MTRYLPPPSDLTALSDREFAECCKVMAGRFEDCTLHVWRLLKEAGERLGKERNE